MAPTLVATCLVTLVGAAVPSIVQASRRVLSGENVSDPFRAVRTCLCDGFVRGIRV